MLPGFFLLLSSLVGQAQVDSNEALPLQVEYNVIYYDNDSALSHFFTALDSLIHYGNRKLNILHFGDSHLQGGFFSNEMRILLQTTPFFSNGGRGLIFPYKIAGTNGPLHYGVEYTGNWEYAKCTQSKRKFKTGVSGYVVATTDTAASVKLWTSTRHGNPPYEFDRITVWHSRGAVRPVIADSITEQVQILEGKTVFFLRSLRDTVYIRFEADTFTSPMELYGVLLENEDPGIVYHSVGVNGATVADFLGNELLSAQVNDLNPDLIILSFGSNDAYYPGFEIKKYKEQYARFIDTLGKAAPQASIILTTPGDAYFRQRYFNYNYVKAREAILELAREKGLAVWDFYSVMGGPNSIFEWYRLGYAQPDKMHLTQDGYRLQGQLFYKALLRAYYQYLNED